MPPPKSKSRVDNKAKPLKLSPRIETRGVHFSRLHCFQGPRLDRKICHTRAEWFWKMSAKKRDAPFSFNKKLWSIDKPTRFVQAFNGRRNWTTQNQNSTLKKAKRDTKGELEVGRLDTGINVFPISSSSHTISRLKEGEIWPLGFRFHPTTKKANCEARGVSKRAEIS